MNQRVPDVGQGSLERWPRLAVSVIVTVRRPPVRPSACLSVPSFF